MAGVVFLSDDFTGASDSLATYARHGWRSRLVLRPEVGKDGLDALGLPTDLRALPPDRARAEVDRLWPAIAASGPDVLHLKVCSTFDSAPHVGSIGAVANDLIARFKPTVVGVIGGQPSLGRYCLFGNLFARGPDGAVHRIDRHPVMAQHPVTPMDEADLRVHLAAQGLKTTLVPITDLRETAHAAAALRDGPVLFDMTSLEDAQAITEILRAAGGRQLLIGASSVAEILTGTGPRAEAADATLPPPRGGMLIFAGSRSSTTAAQVACFPGCRLMLSPVALRTGTMVAQTAAAAGAGGVLVHLDPQADYAMAPDALADACAEFVASAVERAPLAALCIAGGDTSSRMIARLGFDALEFERTLAAGAALCVGRHPDPTRDGMRLLLKGGQIGDLDLFSRFSEVVLSG